MLAESKTQGMSTEHLAQAAACLRTLAHPARLRLVERLLQGRYPVGELATMCNLRQSVASEHLRLMEHCGLLKRAREGRHTYYSIGHPCLVHLMECIENRLK